MSAVETRIAEVLRLHQAGEVEKDCDEGCCWQHFCTCGDVVRPSYDDNDFDDEYGLDDLVKHQVRAVVDDLRRLGHLL